MSKQQPVAVVAGVGPGLGAAVCRKLAAAGYAVAGLARSTEFGDKLSAEVNAARGKMTFIACELTQAVAVEAAFAAVETRLGVPSVLVYNAGTYLTAPVAETAPRQFKAQSP